MPPMMRVANNSRWSLPRLGDKIIERHYQQMNQQHRTATMIRERAEDRAKDKCRSSNAVANAAAPTAVLAMPFMRG
jgi:Tfp pilus assembly protein PilE